MEVQDLEDTSPDVQRTWSNSYDSMDEDAKWLQRFEKKFHHYSGEDNLIQLDEFIQVLNIKESFFAERFFEFVDQDKSGSISLKELLTALRLLINGKPTDKLHFLFKVYDVDGNGSIDFEELRTVLRFCMAESALSLSEDILCELTEVLFEDADTDGNGKITFEELRNQLDRYPDIASNLTISAAEWLKPPRRSARGNDNINLYFGKLFKTIRLLSNNLSTVFLLVIFFSINIACGVWGVMDVYTTTPDKPWLMLARFNGRPLNFNCSFILVLMLRKSLTWLRSTRLAAILPVDQHVTLHKLVGIVVVLEAFLHAAGHFGNCADLIIQNTTEYTAWEILFTQASGIGWVAALAFPTGWPIIIILIFICTFSFPFVRRKGYFQVFYWTHQLSILFWLILILHARYFWAVFIIPGVIYLIERTLRLSFIRRVRNGKTYIKEAVNLPASVTYLIITRPPNFDFRAGEYVFICIPSIASHEWHPFTVSSAPELKEYITVHIRAQGNWTKRIFNFVKKYNNEKVGSRKESQRLEALIEEGSPSGSNTNNLKCTSVVSVLRNENETSIHGTPATVRNIAVLSKDDDRFAVTNFSAKYDTKEDLTSNRSSELYGSSPNGWMKSEIVVDDRKALLSRASSKSGSSSNSNNDLTASSSAARSHGTLPELRGTPPMAMKRQKQGLKSGKRSNLKNANRVKPMTIGDSSPRLSDSERLRTVSESMANNNNSASTQPEEPQQGADRNTDNQQSQSNKRLTNAVSMTMKTGRLLRHKRSAFVQRRTQHSLDLTNHVGWEVDDHTGIEIIIDGPYGAPSQHIYEAEHAVLIAGGIGVTPFASILQSIHQRYKEYKLFDPMCWSSSHIPNSDDKTFNLRKVDFVWINRHQKSFEWFISLLNLIEIEQEEIDPSERLINMHLYMTSALSRNDVKAIGLYVALDLIHQKQRRDMITGLMTRTQAGRPDWDKLFTTIGQENCGKVTVFFCGSPQLGHVVQQKCHEHGFGFRKENF